MAPIGTSEVTTAVLVLAVIGGGLALVSDNPIQLVEQSTGVDVPDRSGSVGETPVPTVGGTGGDAALDPINDSKVARELMLYLNARRTNHEDTSQMVWSSELAAQADQRAEWLASHQQLEHPEEAPYSCSNREVTAYTYAYGEIEAPGGGTVAYNGDETAIAKGLLNQWEANPPSREQLYGTPYYQGAAGVATVQTDNGTRVYAVMVFCQRT